MGRYAPVRIVALLCSLGWPTLAPAASADWPKALTLGTASPGGVYYVYGEAMAQLLTEKLGITVNTLPTQGPVHNEKLIEGGGIQLGLITMGIGLQGWNGTGDWTGGKHFRSMRALFPMYDTPLQIIVLPRSGISSLAQLEKKSIGVGPRAGTGGTYVPDIMKVLGIQTEINYGSIGDMAAELKAGRYEAIVALTGAPMPAVQQLEMREPVTFVSLTSEQSEAVRKAMPEFSPSKILPSIYSTLNKDYNTVGVYNFAVGRADLPDDLVYQLVKAIFENHARLVEGHSSANETVPENVVKDTFLPFHPGAIRYYREIGLKIPDMLVPTH